MVAARPAVPMPGAKGPGPGAVPVPAALEAPVYARSPPAAPRCPTVVSDADLPRGPFGAPGGVLTCRRHPWREERDDHARIRRRRRCRPAARAPPPLGRDGRAGARGGAVRRTAGDAALR